MFYYYIKFRAYCPNNPYLVLILWLSLPIDGIFCVVAFLKFYLLYKLLTTAPRHHKKKKKKINLFLANIQNRKCYCFNNLDGSGL